MFLAIALVVGVVAILIIGFCVFSPQLFGSSSGGGVVISGGGGTSGGGTNCGGPPDGGGTSGGGSSSGGGTSGGGSSSGSGTSSGGTSSGSLDVKVESSVGSYSWDELSEISAAMSSAGSRSEGIEIAKKYHLCQPDGSLDGTEVITITLSDGTKCQAQVVGFFHDKKESGGYAAISFITTASVANRPMNSRATNAGGWRNSSMRKWLNDEFFDLLPSDLQGSIIAVKKETNNSGRATKANASTTSDKLWLLSYVEITGSPDWTDWDAVYNAEGKQYALFTCLNVDPHAPNAVLKRGASWWTRSPHPGGDDCFQLVQENGDPGVDMGASASDARGVVVGFSV